MKNLFYQWLLSLIAFADGNITYKIDGKDYEGYYVNATKMHLWFLWFMIGMELLIMKNKKLHVKGFSYLFCS